MLDRVDAIEGQIVKRLRNKLDSVGQVEKYSVYLRWIL